MLFYKSGTVADLEFYTQWWSLQFKQIACAVTGIPCHRATGSLSSRVPNPFIPCLAFHLSVFLQHSSRPWDNFPRACFYAAEGKNGCETLILSAQPLCVNIGEGSANSPVSRRAMTGRGGQERHGAGWGRWTTLWRRGAEPAAPSSARPMLPASLHPCAWQRGGAEPGAEAPIPSSPMGKSQAGFSSPWEQQGCRARSLPCPRQARAIWRGHMWHLWHYVRSGCCRPGERWQGGKKRRPRLLPRAGTSPFQW